jgi:hypothetical protein
MECCHISTILHGVTSQMMVLFAVATVRLWTCAFVVIVLIFVVLVLEQVEDQFLEGARLYLEDRHRRHLAMSSSLQVS